MTQFFGLDPREDNSKSRKKTFGKLEVLRVEQKWLITTKSEPCVNVCFLVQNLFFGGNGENL